jgi:hypothetical protein
VTDVELEKDELHESLNERQQEIERQGIVIKNLTRDLLKAQVRHDADRTEIKRIEGVVDEKQSEIAILRTKLRDRTKDLLALERMSACQPPGPFGGEDPPCDCDDWGVLFPKINPVFLGPDVGIVE